MSEGHSGRLHCEHSPSSAYRWMACPGSIQLCRSLPPGVPSVYAEEGTSAHELAQYCLAKGAQPWDFFGKEWDGRTLDADFTDAVGTYVEYVRGLMARADWSAVERAFYLDPLDPPEPMYGTSDFICLTGDTLEVVDYKHGQGVPVDVEGNKQLRYYALGALLSLHQEQAETVQTVRITVVQPRAPHRDGAIRSEDVPVLELLDFALDLFEAVVATLQPAPLLVAGSHCRFCPAHAVCPALKQQALALAGEEFFHPEPLKNPPAPELLTVEELGQLMTRFNDVEAWMSAVREFAFRTLSNGHEIPGWKLVPKRATRKWANEQALSVWLRKQKLKPAQYMEPSVFLSPAQMEKAIGKDRIPEDLISKVSSGLTLAEASDARPAVPITSAAEEFSALPN